MTAKRILFFGAAGQVGQSFRQLPLPAGCELRACDKSEIDITRHDDVRDAMQTFKPDLVINAAGMTKVDGAEKNPEAARAVNAEAPGHMAALCAARDIPLLHLSTDYVFRGDGNVPYRPDDAMDPVNEYGKSKMLGEQAVRRNAPKHVIVRLSSVFSALGRNILTNTIKLIEERDTLRMVDDQTACPTPAAGVAQTLMLMAEALLNGKTDGFGTYHYCGTPPCTRYAFTQAVMDYCALFTSCRPAIVPVGSDAYADLAPRPRWSVLDCAKIAEDYGIAQPCWREGLEQAVRSYYKDRKATQ